MCPCGSRYDGVGHNQVANSLSGQGGGGGGKADRRTVLSAIKVGNRIAAM